MALIKCKECGKEISSTIKNCPHCGYRIESDSDQVFNKIGQISKIIIISVFSMIFLWAFCTGDNEKKGSSIAQKLYPLYSNVKQEVLKDLKSPSTATFAEFEEIKYKDNGDDTYIIQSYVDSQNSFGATIRTNFRCTVTEYGVVENLVFY